MQIRKQYANILTLANLSLGLVSLIFSASTLMQADGQTHSLRPYWVAALLILLAACLDRFDGKVARKTDTVSDLGKQLDSLSDLVSFGVAPALLTWKVHLGLVNRPAWWLLLISYTVVLLFPLCGAIRLAKFNIQEDPSYFVGVPITIAGAVLAGVNLIHILVLGHAPFSAIGILTVHLITLILALLMVAPLRLKKR